MAPTISAFPNEVLVEIFRDDCLSRSDLARLCLVSRGLLQSTRATLYEKIRVRLVSSRGADNNITQDVLSQAAWRLLRTLQDYPELAKLVRGVEFRRSKRSSPTRVVLTIQSAITTFLGLSPNLYSVSIAENLSDHLSSILPILTVHKDKIKNLMIGPELSPAHNFTAERLTKLRRLASSRIDKAAPVSDACHIRLVELDTYRQDTRHLPVGLLEQSKSTLRKLSIHVDYASNLRYAEFHNLHYLHLYDFNVGSYVRQTLPTGIAKITRIWSELRGAPNLKVLSLDGNRYAGDLEEDLFDNPDVTIDGVRRLVFTDEIPLDRIARLIYGPLFPNLREILVEYPFKHAPNLQESLGRIEALGAMCRVRQIELYFEDWWCRRR